VAISHGHYDHSGGFKALVKAGFKGTLATGSGFFDRKYASDGISLEYLGNDFDEAYLNNVGIAHKVCCNWVERIADGIFILSAFPRVHPSETPNPRFLVERGGRMVKDDFGDEISIAVGSSKGFILILGCSHPGVMNILDSARSSLPGPIFAVIGGTHLVEASPERLKESVDYLDGMDIETIGVSHCTGVMGVAALSERAHGFYRNTTGHSLFVPMNSDLACTAANRR
jgi:7,8-dihydropterin-6-yl-methyl-4-(beta-D-ribofuranosyl)aminobenzene 5'-phosphate synthase